MGWQGWGSRDGTQTYTLTTPRLSPVLCTHYNLDLPDGHENGASLVVGIGRAGGGTESGWGHRRGGDNGYSH